MGQSLNRCEFIGRLTKDPELRYTTNGKAKTSFTIAVDGFKEESTAFPRCVAWGKLAEICGEYLEKGKQVYVAGRYEERSYEQNGEKRFAHEFTIDTMQMLGTKEKSQSEQIHDEEAAAHASPDPEDDIPF